MMDEHVSFDDIINRAEDGNPHFMLELSKLYRMGVFGDDKYEEYIHLLHQFFETPIIMAIVDQLEEDNCNDDLEYEADLTWPIPCDMDLATLTEDIIEAGISLGLYYRNSCHKDELLLARHGLLAALDASKWDYMVHKESDGSTTDILSILTKVLSRLEELGYGEDYE